MQPPPTYPWLNWKNGLFAFVVFFLMWPMLKGTYYKNFADEPVSGVVWQESYQAALEESEKTGKPILLDFSASWCPPCQVMKHEVWTDEEVGKVTNDHYVPFLVDVDLPENRHLSQKYQVSSIPNIVVIDPQGQLLKRSGSMSASQTSKFLQP